MGKKKERMNPYVPFSLARKQLKTENIEQTTLTGGARSHTLAHSTFKWPLSLSLTLCLTIYTMPWPAEIVMNCAREGEREGKRHHCPTDNGLELEMAKHRRQSRPHIESDQWSIRCTEAALYTVYSVMNLIDNPSPFLQTQLCPYGKSTSPSADSLQASFPFFLPAWYNIAIAFHPVCGH